MNTIYFNADMDDEVRRQRLYEGSCLSTRLAPAQLLYASLPMDLSGKLSAICRLKRHNTVFPSKNTPLCSLA